ncbi:MAG: hypothetical protein ACOC9W_02020 [Persicimonas sp.]
MLNTPSSKKLWTPSGLSNVGSRGGNVERTRPPVSRLRLVVVGAVVFVGLFAILIGPTGCVESAECNATVRCPDDEVCYDYECRAVCESADECAASEQCAPCMPDGASGDRDHCFGSELNACIAEAS